MNVEIRKANSLREIQTGVGEIFGCFYNVLPDSKDARILLKPNLNANMNALTGNTTDLRLIAAILMYLKDLGYHRITIGEGTNSGYYRNDISVISRLRIDRLARHFGVGVRDLNRDRPVDIAFENGIRAGVAETCFQSDFWINLPKIKTHFEVGMSVCLKNLMGCLVGQDNKKKTHQSLAKNIVNLNMQCKPQLHVIDGLIAMEGLGPTRGTPVHLGLILGGTDPFLLDMVCARIAGFNPLDILTLQEAESRGLIGKAHFEYVNHLNLDGLMKAFNMPRANILASFVHHPRRQKYFLAVRNTRLLTWLAATRGFGRLLFLSGLRQDNFIREEMRLDRLTWQSGRCEPGCTKCSDYCPLGLNPVIAIQNGDTRCIGCLYCFLVCPSRAIAFEGRLGFMAEQLRQYDELVRTVC
ncbi:DUF362 domain-containing protein [Desulfatirhabdium butyrativorans]|uniref:DUF362 domain-containing protein n=1 Tax=Desulfatirhabdium butyrativorans TaxID=340467 RepID=UPI0003F79359|nr:DUF362 domain-containing protein [Desulfatirhabdium butyrativorans]